MFGEIPIKMWKIIFQQIHVAAVNRKVGGWLMYELMDSKGFGAICVQWYQSVLLLDNFACHTSGIVSEIFKNIWNDV